MLSLLNLQRHLHKLDLGEDYSYTDYEAHDSGNMVLAFYPDLDFDLVKERALAKKYYFLNIDNRLSTSDRLVFKVYESHDGYDVLCDLSVKRDNVGCSISLLVRVFEYYTPDGVLKPLLGFDDYAKELAKI